jgi:molybdopterin/thiamine biosynthesis adenylyltransferase
VRNLGEGLRITYNPQLLPAPTLDRRALRTVSAWGEHVQADLCRQRIGVIGAGSVGVPVAESLVRTGVGSIAIIEFDTVRLHNLDRLGHATLLDVLRRRPKASMLAEALRRYGVNPHLGVQVHECSVVEDEGYRTALDCDVLFSCVDRPWPRQLLDHIAYAHLIPVIDGGIAVHAKPRLKGADWRAHVAMPGRPCMECIGQYSPADVALERAGDLDDPRYIDSLPEDHPHRARENVYAFSTACASLEVLQWLSISIAPQAIADVGSWHFHFVTGTMDRYSGDTCKATCLQTGVSAMGDHAQLPPPTGDHAAAREEIAAREQDRHRRAFRILERLVTSSERISKNATGLAMRYFG